MSKKNKNLKNDTKIKNNNSFDCKNHTSKCNDCNDEENNKDNNKDNNKEEE